MKSLKTLAIGLVVGLLLIACSGSTPASQETTQGDEQPGLLAPVDLSPDTRKIETESIRYDLAIRDVQFRSGRFLDFECDPDGRVNIATVRGIDRFEPGDEGNWIRTSAFDTPGHAWSVTRVGSVFWVSDDYAGVTIIDAIDGAVKARWPQLSSARFCIRINSGAMLVCRHSAGASIVAIPEADYSDQVEILAQIDLGGKAFHANIKGTTAYIATMNGGYQAWSLEDPALPRKIWKHEGINRAVYCCKRGDMHIVADLKRGIHILRDRGDQAPETIGFMAFPKETRSVEFLSNTIIIVACTQALHALDISKPEMPVEIAEFKADSESRVVQVCNGSILLTDNDGGWHQLAFDAQSGFSRISGFALDTLLTDVVIEGDLVFATRTRAGVQSCRLDDEGKLKPLGTLDAFEYAVALDVQDDVMAVVDYRGLTIVDAADPANMRVRGYWKSPGRASGVQIYGNTVWVADWFQGVHLVDITDRDDLKCIATVDLEGWATDVVVTERYAYVCAVNGGLYTIDHRDPGHPVITGHDAHIAAPEGAVVGDGVLYVVDFNAGLIVMDLSDPANPVRRSYIPMSTCKGVAYQASTLLLGDYIYGIRMYDVSAPFEPVLIGRMETPGKAYEVIFSQKQGIGIVADWHDLISFEWMPPIGSSTALSDISEVNR